MEKVPEDFRKVPRDFLKSFESFSEKFRMSFLGKIRTFFGELYSPRRNIIRKLYSLLEPLQIAFLHRWE